MIQTPFLMDSHYIQMVDKDSPKTNKFEKRGHYSIENDEER